MLSLDTTGPQSVIRRIEATDVACIGRRHQLTARIVRPGVIRAGEAFLATLAIENSRGAVRAYVVKRVDRLRIFANNDQALTSYVANDEITRFLQLFDMTGVLPGSRKDRVLLSTVNVFVSINTRFERFDQCRFELTHLDSAPVGKLAHIARRVTR